MFALSSSSADPKPWRLAAHLALIDDALIDAAVLGDQWIVINLPPRHGKSSLVSRYFPAWLCGAYPDRRVILASYAAEIAQTWGASARDLLYQHGPAFGVSVRSDASRRGRWEVAEHGGGMLATGVAGQITGYGADVFIIDDPVKGPVESQSELMQERLWDWYHAVALTRMQPGASMIVVQTRWAEMDLTGRLLEEDPGKWRQIVLPAIAGDDDLLGREPGAALWPEMFSVEMLEERKRGESDYWWNALYQQAPSPPGGALFHRSWFRHYTITADGAYQVEATLADPSPRPVSMRDCHRFCTFDTAASQRDSASYTVIATWDVHRASGRMFLVDIVRDRLEGPDIMPTVQRIFQERHPLYMIVEREFIGLTVIQHIRRAGLPVREISARGMGDKWTRANDAASKMQGGMISWPRGLRDFEEELAAFPHGAHNDQVDALAYAAIHQSKMGHGQGRIVAPRGRLPGVGGMTG